MFPIMKVRFFDKILNRIGNRIILLEPSFSFHMPLPFLLILCKDHISTGGVIWWGATTRYMPTIHSNIRKANCAELIKQKLNSSLTLGKTFSRVQGKSLQWCHGFQNDKPTNIKHWTSQARMLTYFAEDWEICWIEKFRSGSQYKSCGM